MNDPTTLDRLSGPAGMLTVPVEGGSTGALGMAGHGASDAELEEMEREFAALMGPRTAPARDLPPTPAAGFCFRPAAPSSCPRRRWPAGQDFWTYWLARGNT